MAEAMTAYIECKCRERHDRELLTANR
jgi:hypothetical protein